MKSKIVWKYAELNNGFLCECGYLSGTLLPVFIITKYLGNYLVEQRLTTIMPDSTYFKANEFNAVEAAKEYIENEFLQQLHDKIWEKE